MRGLSLALCALFMIAAAAPAAACRLALALGLDVSRSVDAAEYRLQLDGLAAALGTPEVARALLSGGPVALAAYEWSGPGETRLLFGWTMLEGSDTLGALAANLRGTTRRPMTENTGLGAAMLAGGALLDRAPRCWRRVLDISGDGLSNAGPRPETIALPGTTVNALVIGSDDAAPGDRRAVDIGELSSYFRAHVLRGSDAFVQVALGYDDFARAMTAKLIREGQPLAIGRR